MMTDGSKICFFDKGCALELSNCNLAVLNWHLLAGDTRQVVLGYYNRNHRGDLAMPVGPQKQATQPSWCCTNCTAPNVLQQWEEGYLAAAARDATSWRRESSAV